MEEYRKIRDMEEVNALVKEMESIYQVREEEYQLREEAFQKRKMEVDLMLQKVEEKNTAAEKERNELEREQHLLDGQKMELARKEQEIREQEEALKERKAKLDDQESTLNLKKKLELEKIRNQTMALERVKEEYEHRLALQDKGIEDVAPTETTDLSAYMLKTEHEEALDELKKENAELKGERMRLLQKVLELSNGNGQKPEEMQPFVSVEEETPGIQSASSEREESQGQYETAENMTGKAVPESRQEVTGQPEEMQEELTAEILKHYLERNEPKFESLKIYHSDQGDQLSTILDGKSIRFLFAEPPSFDICAERKNSSRLRKTLEKYNQEYPGVQFRYEEMEGKVYATGYFTNSILVYQLMERVKEIADCFRGGE